MWSYPSTPPYIFIVWCLINPRENVHIYIPERTEFCSVLWNLKIHNNLHRSSLLSFILSQLNLVHTLIPYKTQFNIIYLRSVLRTLSVAQMYKVSTRSMIRHHWQNITSSELVGWLINKWEEEFVAKLEAVTRHWPGETKKNHKLLSENSLWFDRDLNRSPLDTVTGYCFR
jgi:beta-galactosidase GanA